MPSKTTVRGLLATYCHAEVSFVDVPVANNLICYLVMLKYPSYRLVMHHLSIQTLHGRHCSRQYNMFCWNMCWVLNPPTCLADAVVNLIAMG